MPPDNLPHTDGRKCPPLRPITEYRGDERPASLAVCENHNSIACLRHRLKMRHDAFALTAMRNAFQAVWQLFNIMSQPICIKDQTVDSDIMTFVLIHLFNTFGI